MKKSVIFFLSFLLAFNISVKTSFSQNLNKILKSHFKALGQKELVNVETVTINGSITQNGMEMAFKQIQKRPSKSYLEVEMQGDAMKQAYNGEIGWMVSPWSGSPKPQKLSGTELKSIKNAANIDGELYNWKERGNELEYVGNDTIKGEIFYQLKLRKKDGDILDYYIDQETNLINKIVMKTKVNDLEIEVEQVFSNHKEFNGIMFPTNIEMKYNGQSTTIIKINSVKMDEPVDNSLFEMPEN